MLKLRNFTISKKVDDRIFTEEDAQEKICEIIAAMEPFVSAALRAGVDDESDNGLHRLLS